jgi:hypothetical protein
MSIQSKHNLQKFAAIMLLQPVERVPVPKRETETLNLLNRFSLGIESVHELYYIFEVWAMQSFV